MRPLWAAFRLGVLHAFAYRLEVVSALLSGFSIVVLNASLWGAAVRGRPELAGLSPLELGTYVIVAWVATTLYSNQIDAQIGVRFREGHIAADLVRPLDLMAFTVSRDLGRAVVSLVLTGGPLLLGSAWLFGLRWPGLLHTWPVLAVSLLLSYGIGAQIGWLVGIMSFRLKNIAGLAHVKATLVALTSGALLPLDALPDALRRVALLLPFAGLSHTPASLFLERWTPSEALFALGHQAFWVLALLALSRWSWRWAQDQLTVQGG